MLLCVVQMAEFMGELLHRLRELPLLSVTAIDGYAIGGGAELATATDFRVFAAGARMAFVHARMGISPGWGGGARLVDLVGRAHALRLLALGTKVDADGAMALGLCDAVSDEGESAAAAAERVLLRPALDHASSHDALRAIKTAVSAASAVPRDVRAAEVNAVASVWGIGANARAIAGGAPSTSRPT